MLRPQAQLALQIKASLRLRNEPKKSGNGNLQASAKHNRMGNKATQHSNTAAA